VAKAPPPLSTDDIDRAYDDDCTAIMQEFAQRMATARSGSEKRAIKTARKSAMTAAKDKAKRAKAARQAANAAIRQAHAPRAGAMPAMGMRANDSSPAAREPAGPDQAATGSRAIRAQFRNAGKAVTGAADKKQPQVRRRRGGTAGDLHRPAARPVMRHGAAGVPAARGIYAVLQTSTAQAGRRSADLGMETPSVQSGSFNLSLCNPFGGSDYGSGGGHEGFDAPASGAQPISPRL
jgi:hypothetical protein